MTRTIRSGEEKSTDLATDARWERMRKIEESRFGKRASKGVGEAQGKETREIVGRKRGGETGFRSRSLDTLQALYYGKKIQVKPKGRNGSISLRRVEGT